MTDLGKALSARTATVRRRAEMAIYQHPALSRRVFGALRTVVPVVRFGSTVVVTSHEGVCEVLRRDGDFSIDHYAPKMNALVGPFILGMPQGPDHEHDRSVLQLVVPQADQARLDQLVARIVAEQVESQSWQRGVDVVEAFCDGVPARLARRYFGLDIPADELTTWGRAIFREFFYNLPDYPEVRQEADAAALEFRKAVDACVARRKADHDPTTSFEDADVLGRMLLLQDRDELGVTDDWIARYLMGLVVGMLPLTSKASALAIDYFLDHPGLIDDIRRADGPQALWPLCSEAMRMKPQSPGQFRIATRQTSLSGRGRAWTIPDGAKVFAVTQSAMFDRRAVGRPGAFRADRDPQQLLHFGLGVHSCFGEFISYRVQVPRIIEAVLSQPGVARAPGAAGKLGWTDQFPRRLVVTASGAPPRTRPAARA